MCSLVNFRLGCSTCGRILRGGKPARKAMRRCVGCTGRFWSLPAPVLSKTKLTPTCLEIALVQLWRWGLEPWPQTLGPKPLSLKPCILMPKLLTLYPKPALNLSPINPFSLGRAQDAERDLEFPYKRTPKS